MEASLLRHHKIHFSQARKTPLAYSDVIKRFGKAADMEYAHQFCNGDNEEINKCNNDMVQEFIRLIMPEDTDPPTINSDISLTNVKEGFRIWSAKTSTSPSGRSIILYKI